MLTTTIPYFNAVVLANAVLIIVFALRQLYKYLNNENRPLSGYYVLGGAAFIVSTTAFALIDFFIKNPYALNLTNSVSIVAEMLGFAYFLRVPLYLWFPRRAFVLASHLIWLYILTIIAALILSPLDFHSGETTNEFPHVIGLLAAMLIIIAFGANLWLYYSTIRKSGELWKPRSLGLLTLFVFAGVGTSYIFLGTNKLLLDVAATLIFIGLVAVILGSFSPGPTGTSKQRPKLT